MMSQHNRPAINPDGAAAHHEPTETPTRDESRGNLPGVPTGGAHTEPPPQSALDARMTRPLMWRLTHSPSVADVAEAGKELLRCNNVHINYALQEVAEGVVRDAILGIARVSTTAELSSNLQRLKDELSELLAPKNRHYFEGKVYLGVRSAEATLGRRGEWDKAEIVLNFMLSSK